MRTKRELKINKSINNVNPIALFHKAKKSINIKLNYTNY